LPTRIRTGVPLSLFQLGCRARALIALPLLTRRPFTVAPGALRTIG
jgi:hypothetical protein